MSVWKRHWVNYIAALLFALWLAGQTIFQIFVAETPRPAFYWLNGANLLQLFALVVGGALLLVTNTRRPAGIDPNVSAALPPSVQGLARDALDPFLLTTEELAEHERRRLDADPNRSTHEPRPARRPVVLDEEGELYGRRATDIPISDIKRVIAALDQIKGAGADPEEVLHVPEWARELQRQGAAAEAGDLPDLVDPAPPSENGQ